VRRQRPVIDFRSSEERERERKNDAKWWVVAGTKAWQGRKKRGSGESAPGH
jgi:hypothetical protein